MEENTQPPPLPDLADGRFHQIDPNSIPLGRIGMAITSTVYLGIALVGLLFASLTFGLTGRTIFISLGVWVGLIPVLGVYCWVWPGISYRYISYCLKEDCLIWRKGVFFKMETLVPKSRIQHTDITQGPLQRSYGISDLIVHTAGTRYAIVPCSGLSEDLAPRLRNHLLDRRDDDRAL